MRIPIMKLIKDIETKKQLKLKLINVLKHMNYDYETVQKVNIIIYKK
jgi:hypothetical protein